MPQIIPAVHSADDQESSASTGLSRRDLLKGAAVAGAALMIPLSQGCAHAADAGWESAGKASDFVKDAPQRVALKSGAVLFITRTSDTDFTAVSAKCTHRGCEVGWNKDGKDLECPCHGAAFQTDGKNIHGTKRSPDNKLGSLQAVPARQKDGQVEVNLAGIPPASIQPGRDA